MPTMPDPIVTEGAANEAKAPTTEEPQNLEKDRTAEQFEKLKQSNRELKEERDAEKEENKKLKNVLDSLTPTPTPQPPVQNYQNPTNQAPSAQNFSNLNQTDVNNVFNSMVDQDGYLDGNKLMQTLTQMNQRAINAEQKAARVEEHVRRREIAESKVEKTNKLKQVHDKYPELDPENDAFDPDFWELVRNDLIGQMMEGKEDPMAAADKWASKRDMTKKEKEKVDLVAEQKTQINATRPRSPMMKGYYEQEESQALIQSVRAGKKGAVAEALRRAGQ